VDTDAGTTADTGVVDVGAGVHGVLPGGRVAWERA
jgi:hypothetical protein